MRSHDVTPDDLPAARPVRDARWAPPAEWRQLLGATAPRDVLARLVPGDPLGLRRLVAERLRLRAVLADPDRVHLRALARCATLAAGRDRGGTGQSLLVEQADAAIDDGISAAAPQGDDARPEGSFAALARPLGLDPNGMARACAAFNRCARADREAFFALVLDRVELADAARRNAVAPVELARRARRALDAVLAAAPRAAREGAEAS